MPLNLVESRKSRLKKKSTQSKQNNDPFLQEPINLIQEPVPLTDEQRVDKLLDFIAVLVVDLTLKRAREQKTNENQPEKEQQ